MLTSMQERRHAWKANSPGDTGIDAHRLGRGWIGFQPSPRLFGPLPTMGREFRIRGQPPAALSPPGSVRHSRFRDVRNQARRCGSAALGSWWNPLGRCLGYHWCRPRAPGARRECSGVVVRRSVHRLQRCAPGASCRLRIPLVSEQASALPRRGLDTVRSSFICLR